MSFLSFSKSKRIKGVDLLSVFEREKWVLDGRDRKGDQEPRGGPWSKLGAFNALSVGFPLLFNSIYLPVWCIVLLKILRISLRKKIANNAGLPRVPSKIYANVKQAFF